MYRVLWPQEAAAAEATKSQCIDALHTKEHEYTTLLESASYEQQQLARRLAVIRTSSLPALTPAPTDVPVVGSSLFTDSSRDIFEGTACCPRDKAVVVIVDLLCVAAV